MSESDDKQPEVENPGADGSFESAEESLPNVEESGDGVEAPTTIGDNEWLDPTSTRHRRRRHTPPASRSDRLRRRWRRWRRKRRKIAETAHWYRPRNVSLALALLVFIGVFSVLLSTYIRISDVRRAPLIPVVQSTPSVGTNIVQVSSDGKPGALALDPNTLVVQFIHLSSNYRSGEVIDLPSNMVIGTGASAKTIAAIYATPGPSGGVLGLIGALQTSMNLTVNHVIQTSFAGYANLTNDLGGLSIQTDTGWQTMTGAQAQTYVAQSPPAPEIGRRFQHWSKAMIKGILQPGVLLNPFKVWSVFSDMTSGIVVDETLNDSAFIGLLWHLKSLDPSNLHFYTAPSDPVAFARLSDGLRTDNPSLIGLYR